MVPTHIGAQRLFLHLFRSIYVFTIHVSFSVAFRGQSGCCLLTQDRSVSEGRDGAVLRLCVLPRDTVTEEPGIGDREMGRA